MIPCKTLSPLVAAALLVYSVTGFSAPMPAAFLPPGEPVSAAPDFQGTPAIVGADPQPQSDAANPIPVQPAPAQPAPAQPAPAETAFQAMVKESLGTSLPVYGLNFFGQALESSGLTAMPATADYVIGVGDEILIRASGGVDINFRATVDQNGLIFIPKIGTITAAGTKYQDLGAEVAVEIGKKFRNFRSAVTLGQLRGSQVFVVGRVSRPGSYVLPAYATTITALLAAGGPSDSGSLRNITVKNGKGSKTLDLYRLLAAGDKSQDLRLQPGDVVLVGTVGKQAAIAGAVKNPGIFELADGESYADLVKYAGGFTVAARPQQMRVEHVDKQTRRAVSSLALANVNQTVNAGDIVRVPAVTMDYGNAVTLRGAVAENMRTPWKEGMRVADLVQSRDDLIVPAYWLAKNNLAVAAAAAIAEDERLTSSGKTEVNWDYAVVERLNKDTMETDLVSFNLRRALAKDTENNVLLQAGDVVTIFSKEQMRVPEQSRSRYVRLEGEVASPGVYKAEASDTLRTLVAKAGGLTAQAYLYGAEFHRASAKDRQQKQMDTTVAKLEESARRAASEATRTASTLDEVRAAKEQAAVSLEMTSALRDIRATGRIVLEVQSGRNSIKDLPDIKLEDNDRLVIPAVPSTISVIGAVYNENTYLYKKNRSPDDYLKLAGGVMPGVSYAKILVSRADGAIVPGEDVSDLNPGDTVIAVDDPSKKPFIRGLKEWSQVLYQFGLAAAGIAVFR